MPSYRSPPRQPLLLLPTMINRPKMPTKIMTLYLPDFPSPVPAPPIVSQHTVPVPHPLPAASCAAATNVTGRAGLAFFESIIEKTLSNDTARNQAFAAIYKDKLYLPT